MLKAQVQGIIFVVSLALSASSYAAEAPIKFGNQLTCTGEVEGSTTQTLSIVLQNSDSFQTSEDPNRHPMGGVWLKSLREGGRWFIVANEEDQNIWIYRKTQDATEMFGRGTYGSQMVLSSGRPKLEILNPALKFEIYLSAGEGLEIKMEGYFAVKNPQTEEVVVAPSLVCKIEVAVKQ